MNVRSLLLSCIFLVGSYITHAQSYDPVIPEGPLATIEFEQTTFNFGEITEGELVQNVVRFTNTSDEPLIISNAKATCGCTVPQWPKDPIMPGETSEFVVQFDSKSKGAIKGKKNSKRVTITANTDPVHSYVTITGTVFKQEEGATKPARHASFDVPASSVKLWPNPAVDFVKIDLSAYVGKAVAIDVYSMIGQRMSSKMINAITDEELTIDTADYESGTYTFSISISGHNRIAKTIVVN